MPLPEPEAEVGTRPEDPESDASSGEVRHIHPSEDQTVLDPLQGGDQRRVVHGVGIPLPRDWWVPLTPWASVRAREWRA